MRSKSAWAGFSASGRSGGSSSEITLGCTSPARVYGAYKLFAGEPDAPVAEDKVLHRLQAACAVATAIYDRGYVG
jgi:hypothetical protein